MLVVGVFFLKLLVFNLIIFPFIFPLSILQYTEPGLRLGNINNLPRLYSGDVEQIIFRKNLQLISDCYPDYSIVADGTPSFDKAEAIQFRGVKKTTLEVVTVVLSLTLYKRSLKGEGLSKNMIDVF